MRLKGKKVLPYMFIRWPRRVIYSEGPGQPGGNVLSFVTPVKGT